MKILITGAAGFIGFHAVNHLLDKGHSVIGIDNLCDNRDLSIKTQRLKLLSVTADNFEYSHEYPGKDGLTAIS